jgi:hypothetical protein
MNDVRVLVALEKKLHCCPTKKTEPFSVIVMSVKHTAIKKVLFKVRLDKKAFQSVHPPEVNVTVHPLLIVGHPQITEAFGEAGDEVKAHAIVLWQHDLKRVAADSQFLGQPVHNVA